MLNPTFSREFLGTGSDGYQLPSSAIALVRNSNRENKTGVELRTQRVFGDELWRKIKTVGLSKADWSNMSVLDVCCGTGFLSYHLIQRASPRRLLLMDISHEEIEEARNLVGRVAGNVATEYLVADAIMSGLPAGTFDVIIGNSFLHHFYDVPKALKEFYRLLKPRGIFVTLHEPMGAAISLESGSLRQFMKYIVMGPSYIEGMRHQGRGISPHGGTDVWIFRKADIRKLARDAGFVNIHTRVWNLFRPIVVAKGMLHLGGSKQQLTRMEEVRLRAAIAADSLLSYSFPPEIFGSISLSAQKP